MSINKKSIENLNFNNGYYYRLKSRMIPRVE